METPLEQIQKALDEIIERLRFIINTLTSEIYQGDIEAANRISLIEAEIEALKNSSPPDPGPATSIVGLIDEPGLQVYYWNDFADDIPVAGCSKISIVSDELHFGINAMAAVPLLDDSGGLLLDNDGLPLEGIDPDCGPEHGNFAEDTLTIDSEIFRAEIRDRRWGVLLPKGSRKVFSWTYTFPPTYTIDKNNQCGIFQNFQGDIPVIMLWIVKENQFAGVQAGEIVIVNKANSLKRYTPTGIIPKGGDSIDFEVDIFFDSSIQGRLVVKINSVVYTIDGPTIMSTFPYGGNSKWGIYKWPWREAINRKLSIDSGAGEMELYMGPLTIETTLP